MVALMFRQIRRFASALMGRLILAAGAALMVLAVGVFIMGPAVPSNGLGDNLLPSFAPDPSSTTLVVNDDFLLPAVHHPGTNATPSPTPIPTPTPQTHLVTRIVLAKTNMDLPVIEPSPDEVKVPKDVAERLGYYTVPGNAWVTYLYAHAQPGMFGGLLVASWKPDAYLLGAPVLIYTDDSLLYTYQITEIHRDQKYTSWEVADSLVGEALVLQTCEDSHGDGPKLIVVARLVSVAAASYVDSHPVAHPRF